MSRKLRRLLGMSPAEIAYRSLEQIRVAADRRRWLRRDTPAPARRVLPERDGSFLSYLRQDLGPRFWFDPTPRHRDELRTWLATREAARLTQARAEADAVVAHRVELLGLGPVEVGAAIDWHQDPVAGARWPLRFWADYDLVDGDGPDPKVVHELARHGHLPRLAGAYYWLGDERYAREVVAQMLSFIEQNPAGWGVHWSSSLELALRVIAWISSLPLIAQSPGLDDVTARRIGDSLLAQLDHVYDYPSLYSSPNTHLIGEAVALFLGGCFLPDAPRADAYRRAGARWLEQEIRRQVGDDGVHKELSTYYHAYALDFFLMAAVLGERSGSSFSAGYRRRVARMAEFLAAVSTNEGRIPLLGDDDGGGAFPLGARHYQDVRGLLSAAAVWLDRVDLYREAEPIQAVWLFGPARVSDFESHRAALAATATPLRTRVETLDLTDAGYSVQSMTSGERHAQVLFDAGQMGMDAGGHAHADALSVLLTVDDRPLLVDPGTFVYNRAPEWRAFFRGTRAHNTVSVDGQDQSETAGTFAWGRKARVTPAPPLDRPWCAYRGGEHDGYRRLPGRVRHRRHLLAIGVDHWVIVDELLGEGTHRCVWHYHLAPDVQAEVSSSSGLVRAALADGPARAGLSFAASGAATVDVLTGRLAPIQGWVAPRYGDLRPATVLEIAVSGLLPQVAVTVVRPWHAPLLLDVDRCNGGLVARATTDRGQELLIVNRTGGALAAAEGGVDEGVLWLRAEGGAVSHWLAAGAGQLVVGDRRLDLRGAETAVTGRGDGRDISGGA